MAGQIFSHSIRIADLHCTYGNLVLVRSYRRCSITKLAAARIGEGLGGFVVEATAALSILAYLAFLWLASRWNQQSSAQGILYSVLTGICVGAGTIAFFLLFQKGGPLSSVPAILAGGAAIMAIAGILFFHEAISWQRLLGVTFAITGLFLLGR